MSKPKVYTSVAKYIDLKKSAKVKDFSGAPDYQWAKRRIEEMKTKESSPAEEMFIEKCKAFNYNLLRQVYFRINDKTYFLDFFIPNIKIAIEIDGAKYHSSEAAIQYDNKRDKAFLRIGIRTVRFKASEVYSKSFLQNEFITKLAPLGRKLHRGTYQTDHQKRLVTLIDKLKNVPYGSHVIISSDCMTVLQSISHGTKPKMQAHNYALLIDFYEIKVKNKLFIALQFTGHGKLDRFAKELVQKNERRLNQKVYSNAIRISI